jgi:predicted ATPase/class 3 adenylate cyclase
MTAQLELSGPVVGRASELAVLEDALAAAGRAGGQYVLVVGDPGIGKSTLVQVFGADLARSEVSFACGRYREGDRTPYAGAAEAIGALVAAMDATPTAERARWRAELDTALGPAVSALAAVVPNLERAVVTEHGTPRLVATPDGRHLIGRASAKLLAVAASFRPVVLAVDDLQWADADSLVLLADLLTASLRNVLFVGALRTAAAPPVLGVLPATGRQMVAVGPLGPDEIATVLAATCGQAPELRVVASEFHHLTRGNPLEVHQLARIAHQDSIVARHADGRVAWDLRALAAMPVSRDAATVLGRAVDRLRPEDAAVMAAAACLGREFRLADAVVAAAAPPEVVGRAIWAGLDQHLVEAVDTGGRRMAPVIDHVTRYRFSHDRVAEAARSTLSGDIEREVHLRIGLAMAEREPPRLFEAARHLALCGGMPGADQRGHAEIELDAARLARRQAAYPLVVECCRAGLTLLGERRWTDHPALARELVLTAVDAAFRPEEGVVLDELLDEAERELGDPADQAHVAYLRIRSMVARNQRDECLAIGLRALDALGEPLPTPGGRGQAAVALAWMRWTLRHRSDGELSALPSCTDRRIIEAQAILNELSSAAYAVRPQMIPLIQRMQLRLILGYGLVPSSPVMLSSYAILLVMTGDRAGAQRFGELALALTDRPEFRDARPRVLFGILNFVRHWRDPVRDHLPLLHDAYQEALDRGDPERAGLLATTLLYQSMFVGRSLTDIDALARAVLPEIRAQRGPDAFCRSIQQMCLNLMGRSPDPFLLTGESGFDEDAALEVARHANDTIALSSVTIIKLGLRFWCGDDRGALVLAEETEGYLAGQTGTSNVPYFHLFNALIRTRLEPNSAPTARAVRQALKLHRKWGAEAPANYAAPHALIRGVWSGARGDISAAERHFDQAITLADQHHLPLIGALAQEEAGTLYARTGRASLARIMVRAAYERWASLDMVVRSVKLAAEHPWLVGQDVIKPGSATVDSAQVHRLGQSLAAAPSLDALAEVLLAAAADSTGAVRTLLLLGEAAELSVWAARTAAGVSSTGIAAADVGYDRALVAEAARRGRAIDAVPDSRTHSDAAVRTAVPLLMRGRAIGVLYAELPASRPARAEALEALCAAAAAPLRNFQLEGRLQAADEQRASLVAAQSRFIPGELLRILDVDDIGLVRSGHRVERRMTVLISDIRGYTSLLEGMTVTEASEVALGFLRTVEVPIITSNGLLQDVRGDEVLAVFDTGPDDALDAGLAMLRALRDHNREQAAAGAPELRIGIGINTGPVALGLVGGVNRMALTVIGDAVNLASRVESTTKRYGSYLLISEDTLAELAEPHRFAIRRMERVGVVNRRRAVTIYEVYDDDLPDVRAAKAAAQPAFDAAFERFDAGEVDAAREAFTHCLDLLPGDPVATLHLEHCDALARGDLRPGAEVALGQK